MSLFQDQVAAFNFVGIPEQVEALEGSSAGNDPKNTKINPSMHTRNQCKTQITPKIEQELDQNEDLSNMDQVPSNARLSEKKITVVHLRRQ